MGKFSQFENYLKEYKHDSLAIDFSEIEEINNTKLCASARNYVQYWYPSGHKNIVNVIEASGFKVEKVDLKNQIVYLKRV